MRSPSCEPPAPSWTRCASVRSRPPRCGGWSATPRWPARCWTPPTARRSALRLARDLDAPEGQAYALWHRSEALSALGRATEAEADAREALAIARAVGHRGWTATANRALGIALVGRDELDKAAAAFAASADAAGESLTLFAAWAAARRALVAVAAGRLDGVDALVARALTIGPPLGHFEARLAEVEMLAARDDPGCGPRACAALRAADEAGYLASRDRLVVLSQVHEHSG